MSADIQPEAKDRIKKLGAVGFLSKPANPSAVEQVLREQGML
jgi:hypothetical protein